MTSSSLNFLTRDYVALLCFNVLATTFIFSAFLSSNIDQNLSFGTRVVFSESDIHDTSLLRPKQPIDDEYRQPFNNTNPFNNSWCSNTTCYNSPICSPCNRRYLFIIATGRSGSTTLLKMFNELPNLRLAGENLDQLYLSYLLSFNLAEDDHFVNKKWVSEGRYMKPKIEGPFKHNALPLGSMSCAVQNVFKAMNPPEIPEDIFEMEDDSKTILGMKVIRIPRSNWTSIDAAVFLKDHFPCSRFIINTRSNMEEQIRSFSKNLHFEVNTTYLTFENDFLKNMTEHLGDAARHIDMTYWREDVSILNDVVSWLGFQNCAFDKIPHENHDGYGADNETNMNVGQHCTYPY